MDITHLTVEVRDKDLNRIGQIPIHDLRFTVTDQFRNVGSWTLSLPSESDLAAILRAPGSGIIVTLEDGSVLLSGPSVKANDAATADDPNGTLTVDGVTDTVLLADRLCFPDPTNLDPANQVVTHDVRTGTCEDLMFAYVNANLGPSAPVSADPNLGSRRDDRVQLGTNLHRGPVVTKRARFDVLGDLLADLAATAGIGFRVVQVGTHLEFQTFAVTDRSQSIRLDIRNNMLAGHQVAQAPPSITRAIVAGQDIQRDPSETDQEWAFERQFVAVSTTDSRAGESLWGRRIEVFVDKRQEDGNDELIQAGEEALQSGGFSQISVQVVPMEDFFSNFGVDWHLGDHLTVVVQGVEMQSDVTGYVLKYDSNGFKMGVVLGDPLPTDQPAATKVQTLDSRVSSLERNTATPAAVTAAALAGIPGEVKMFAGSTAPSGWLVCDGSAVDRIGYADLFAAIGTAYGAGNGSSTFNLPNLLGKVVVGVDPGQTEFSALGATGGEKTHTLTQSEMPSHTHAQNAHTHTQNAHNHTQDPHSHTQSAHSHPPNGGGNFYHTSGVATLANGSFYGANFDDAATGPAQPAIQSATATNQPTTATNNNATATNQNTGGGGAHNNLQPYVAMNYIIKF